MSYTKSAETRRDLGATPFPSPAGKALRAVLAPSLFPPAGATRDVRGPLIQSLDAKLPSILGRMLLERRLITQGQLIASIERQKMTRQRLGQVLVDMGYATPDTILTALGAQLDVATTRIKAHMVNQEAICSLPERVARKHTAFPIIRVRTTLVVAVGTPKNLGVLDALRLASGCEVQGVLALEDEIMAAIDGYYGHNRLPGQAARAADHERSNS